MGDLVFIGLSIGFFLLTWLFLRLCELCQHTEVLQCRRVASYFCAARNFLEEPSHDFAAAGFWKRFGETHFIRFCDCANVLADVIAQFLLQPAADLNPALHCHKSDDALTF